MKLSHICNYERTIFYLYLLSITMLGCSGPSKPTTENNPLSATTSCAQNLPSRFGSTQIATTLPDSNGTRKVSHKGMKFIPSGSFTMGAIDDKGRGDEYPAHEVKVSGFWIDETEVTNSQFAAFVKATGYITDAERKPDWEILKKQLPAGTPKPADDVLVAAALTFKSPNHLVNLDNPGEWWHWTPGANWKHPQGPNSSIEQKGNEPVTQVSWADAVAYAEWAGKRLPTEAEWEYAAKGGLKNAIYPWGSQAIDQGRIKANTWQGKFPIENKVLDKFKGVAPVKSFAPNGYGLYDMAGNVWEWVSDWYDVDYYTTLKGTIVVDPKGSPMSNDPMEPGIPKKVTKGGSFMCNASYCSGYRISSRMKSSMDTALENTGFRCVSSN